MSWLMSAGMAAMSVYSNTEKNKQLGRSQKALVRQIEGKYLDVQNQMSEANRKGGMDLTNLERQALKQQAKMVSAKANSGVAGMSSFYMATNLMQQKALASGSVVSKTESQLREEGRRAVSIRNGVEDSINQLQSQKKSDSAILFEAVMAGAQGYMMGSKLASMSGLSGTAGVSSSASFGSQGSAFMTNGAYTGPYSTFTGG